MGTSPNTGLVVSPDRIVRHMITITAVVVAASTIGQVLKHFFGYDHLLGLIRLTYLNGEATLPSWYASSTLLACALTLAVVGAVKRTAGDRHALYWTGLAALFVYLSLDEAAGIHELWGEPLEQRFALDGALRFAWVIPAAGVVAAVALTYARFVWNLPLRTKLLFILSAVVYVGSAVGVEMLGASYVSLYGSKDFAYSLLVTLEESGEMLGVLLFLHAVLRYLADECGVIRVELLPAAEPVPERSPAVLSALAARAGKAA